MVGHDTLYGIMVTNEFGSANNQVGEAIQEYIEENDEPSWIASFPSAESDQLVLGFSAFIHKGTDFKALDKEWHALMETVPESIKALIGDIGEPDVVVVSGYY